MNKLLYICLFTSLSACQTHQPNWLGEVQPKLFTQPVHISGDDFSFVGSEHLLVVPENRSDRNSRQILLHYFRFPAKQPTGLPPIMFLGAGPGEPYDVEHFYESEHGDRAKAWVWELNFVNQKRDLILVNQRGNIDAPGLSMHDFSYRWKNGSKMEPFDWQQRNLNRAAAFRKQVKYYSAQGIDLKGYSILELVDDVEAIRVQHGYEQLAFIGTSFGSQWGLAYMQKYPHRSDRAIFSGIEPLDHNYDDPDGVWRVLEQIAAYAHADSALQTQLPEVGLLSAYKAVIKRLKTQPQMVQLDIPEEDINEEILVGVDDFRLAFMNPFARGRIEAIESWPKYITELYNGDYRTLAFRSRGRGYHSSALMMAALIDKSLGITSTRLAELNDREANKWLGDVNLYLKELSQLAPHIDVGDAFRQHVVQEIPMILIQGDMDRSTPIGNAKFLMEYVKQGHLITVKRGTHAAKRTLILGDQVLAASIYEFMNLDLKTSTFEHFKSQLPDTYQAPEFNFWPIQGSSLFDQYTDQ